MRPISRSTTMIVSGTMRLVRVTGVEPSNLARETSPVVAQ